MQIPLFPLHTVLYPEGPLPLRIFEPRYLDMISYCLREGTPFGVVQIRTGSETGPALTFDTGTLAEVSDWYQGSDGILGITALGSERFLLQSRERQSDGLLRGEAQVLPAAESYPLPEEFMPLVQILDGVLDDLGRLYVDLPRRYDDAVWVGYRFAEILPFSAQQKQDCLEMSDPLQRLQLVRSVLRDARGVELV
ncbi:MAG: LON peptidase substrate-binding domain-containing protein [Woeseia sp.]